MVAPPKGPLPSAFMLDQHESIRRRLLTELSRLPEQGDVLDWQRSLAAAIIAAEAAGVDGDRGERKYHRHLLRVLGDGLVHNLIPPHTIRALEPQVRRPPSLSAQHEDFEFVMETAATVYSYGLVPIVADLTTLLGTGDLVCTDGRQIVAFECKNRLAPTLVSGSGRVARQRERGERIEKYLSTSSLRDENGVLRVALNMGVARPQPNWPEVEALLRRCQSSPSGVGLLAFACGDYLLATKATDASVAEQLDPVLPSADSMTLPAAAHYARLIDAAAHDSPAPCNYPISADLRVELLERRILLTRVADMSLLDAQFEYEGIDVHLVTERRQEGFTVGYGTEGRHDSEFSPSLVEYGLWNPIALSAMREYLIDSARLMVGYHVGGIDPTVAAIAPGDQFSYATVYTDGAMTSIDNVRDLGVADGRAARQIPETAL